MEGERYTHQKRAAADVDIAPAAVRVIPDKGVGQYVLVLMKSRRLQKSDVYFCFSSVAAQSFIFFRM